MPLLIANKLWNNSLMIFLIRFFPSLANLLVVILFSRNLSQESYGEYQLFWVQLYVFYPFITFGIHNLIVTYSKNTLANILSKISRKHYAIYLSFSLAVALFFGWLQYYTGSIDFITSFLFILSFSTTIITESILIVFKKFNVLISTSLIYAFLFCVVHSLVASSSISLSSLFKFLLILNLFRLFTNSIAILNEVKKDKEGYEEEEIDISHIKKLWLNLGIYDVTQLLSTWIDKFIIAILLTSELTAIYYNGAQNIPFLPLLVSAAGSAVLMQLAEKSSSKSQIALPQLMLQSGKVLSSIVFPIFGFLFFYRNEIIVTVLSDKYVSSIPIFAASLLILPLKAYSFTTALQRMHRGDLINIGAITEIALACILMYPLYLFMDLPGVALSFVISTWIQAIFYLYKTAALLTVKPLTLIPLRNWILKLILVSLLFYGSHYYGELNLTGRSTLYTGSVLMLVLIAILVFMEFRAEQTNGNNKESI